MICGITTKTLHRFSKCRELVSRSQIDSSHWFTKSAGLPLDLSLGVCLCKPFLGFNESKRTENFECLQL